MSIINFISENMMASGEKIHEVRKAMKLTLSDVAKHLKLKSTGHLSQIERGLKEPSESLVELFKKIYSVSENWWTLQEGNMFWAESSARLSEKELSNSLFVESLSDLHDADPLMIEAIKIMKTWSRGDLARHVAQLIDEDDKKKAAEIMKNPLPHEKYQPTSDELLWERLSPESKAELRAIKEGKVKAIESAALIDSNNPGQLKSTGA